MDVDDLLDADATAVATAVAGRQVKATEVIEAALARVDARNPQINALVSQRVDAALAEAAAVVPGSAPLAGVPFVVKDLYAEVAGLPATSGSRLFADRIAGSDTELVSRYRRAGLIVLGMTNSPEMGLNASTEPLLHGPTRNPHDLGRSPGAHRAERRRPSPRESFPPATPAMGAARSAFRRRRAGWSD